MRNYLNYFREPTKSISIGRKLTYSLLILLFGLLMGVAAKLSDMYSEIFGNLLSELSIWLFLATVIAVFSSSPARASLNVFLFFAGMIPSYYITAGIVGSVYTWPFIQGWSVVAVISPIFAYFTWFAKGRGWLPNCLSCGIQLSMIVSSAVLFDKIRVTDIVLILLTAIVLFKKNTFAKKDFR